MRVTPRNLTRPVLKRIGGVWTCHRPIDPVYAHTGFGETPKMAYESWQMYMFLQSLKRRPHD